MKKMNRTYKFDDLWKRLPESLRSACDKCEQDPIYHPEGEVTIHIRLVFEYAETHFPGDDELLVCALFHDIAKPETQRINEKSDGSVRISNIGHENKCEKYIDKHFHLFSDITTNKEKVIEVCKNHMKAHLYKSMRLKKPAKRKAFEELKYFKDIMNFSECDENGKE